MKRSNITVFLVSFLLISCQKNEGKKTNEEIFKSFYDNGSLEMVVTRKKGMNDGKAYFYLSKGTKYADMNYVDGKLYGEIIYYVDGIVVKIENYKNDKLNGLFKSYDKNNNITEEGNYLNDKKIGIWNFYDKNKLVSSEYYGDSLITIYKDDKYFNNPERFIPPKSDE